ncbi:hypothetical protein Syun_023887 [Stephania yunnanensis]|uniref:Uncharacterized protein n=1 Tax=Stephania yunnanensis TaxID=152371 RepID=A0AAP0FAK9_9MAGN
MVRWILGVHYPPTIHRLAVALELRLRKVEERRKLYIYAYVVIYAHAETVEPTKGGRGFAHSWPRSTVRRSSAADQSLLPTSERKKP